MNAAILAVAALTLGAAPDDVPITLHVARAGRDTNSGATPDQALATPAGARDRLRAIRAEHGGELTGPATVLFHEGRYELAEPFVLSPEDSGTASAGIVYMAAPGAGVVLSGGAGVGPWRPSDLDGRAVWAADLPDVSGAPPEARTVRELWVNGERRPRARHPNRGYLRVRDVPDVPAGSEWMDGTTWFRFKDEDAGVWRRLGPGAGVVTFTRWVDTHLAVDSIDEAARLARFSTRNMFLLNPDDLYVVENDRDLLDEPGEWWVDESARVLYYLPRPGEAVETTEGVVPRLTTILQLAGDPAAGRSIGHVSFSGLTFSHATWWFPPGFRGHWKHDDAVGFPQAAAGVPGAIRAEGAFRCDFHGCTVSHVGGYGMELGRGCRHISILRCTLDDLGAGGIKVGETVVRANGPDSTGQVEIADCTIRDGGHIHHQAVGIWIGQSGSNMVQHNLIERFDYSGISVGWTWGYGESSAVSNTIQFNEVRDLGGHSRNAEPPLGDMAGIYTLGTQTGTVIRGNYFHDIAGRSIAWGIYFDEGSTGIVAEGNVVVRTTHGGFHQHYGRDNVVRNNVFAFGRDAQLWRTRREGHNSFTFERNIVVADNDKWFAGDWSDGFVLRNNIYWRIGGGPIPFPGGRALADWQTAGHDAGSIVADPGFADLASGNVSVPSNSPAAAPDFGEIERVRPGPRR